MFLIYNLFYINFLQVFSIKYFCKPFQSPSGLLFRDHYGNRSFIPGDQYGGPDCCYNRTVYRNKSNQKSNQKYKNRQLQTHFYIARHLKIIRMFFLFNQIHEYLSSHNLYNDSQYVFRKKHSTKHAAL